MVSTPIGNLKDVSFRAIDILNAVPLIAAEDTRHTGIMLRHYNIKTPSISYYEHNKFSRIPVILKHLNSGKNIAVVTDSGTPGISDPAYKLIRAAITAGARIESIPGPSAFLTALIVSGLPTDRFIFEGFLPPKKGRKKRLEQIGAIQATIIFYESPKRLVRTLNDIQNFIGDRPAVICRELTKKFEEIRRGTIKEHISHYSSQQPRGEFVIVIGKDDDNVYF
ncbi:MAG: 16S rRNA (cytidine(1402)-2'-O)-methyltransferase [Candidatus Neomarinimicrobiota bacterium]